jgi:hypothetical protein
LTPNDDLNNFNEDQCLTEAFDGETFPFLSDSIQHYLKVEEEQNIWVNPINIQTPNSIVLMNFILPQVLNKNQAMPNIKSTYCHKFDCRSWTRWTHYLKISHSKQGSYITKHHNKNNKLN